MVGYADGYEPPPIEVGVLEHDSAAAEAGWNLYCSGHAPEAFLTDMQGAVQHRWAFPYVDLPGNLPLEHPAQNAWRRVALLPNGGLVAIHEGLLALAVDKDSQLLWTWRGGAHHDLLVEPDGNLLVLGREPRLIASLNGREPLLEDYVVRLDAEGNEQLRVSLYESLLRSPWANLLRAAAAQGGDVLHTNSLALVDESLAARLPGVSAGQLLVCFRELPAIATLDLEQRRITWLLQGPWGAPHDPSIVRGGNLLLFDNMGHEGYSRVIELRPEDGQIVWTHAGQPAHEFFSIFCGAATRLPGGNTLISLSCAGRALEVTPAGQVAWSFASPHRAGDDDELVAALFEVQRIAPESLTWLARDSK